MEHSEKCFSAALKHKRSSHIFAVLSRKQRRRFKITQELVYFCVSHTQTAKVLLYKRLEATVRQALFKLYLVVVLCAVKRGCRFLTPSKNINSLQTQMCVRAHWPRSWIWPVLTSLNTDDPSQPVFTDVIWCIQMFNTKVIPEGMYCIYTTLLIVFFLFCFSSCSQIRLLRLASHSHLKFRLNCFEFQFAVEFWSIFKCQWVSWWYFAYRSF